MIKRFVSYYKPHLKLFLFDMFCALVVAFCDLFYPIIAKNIINDYVPNQNMHLLLVWAAVMAGIYLLKAAMSFMVQYWGHIVGVRIQGDMRKELFEHLQKLPFRFFDETKTGTLMSRIVNDLMEVSELAHHGPENLLLSGLMMILCGTMLIRINLRLTLIVFAVIPFIVLFATLIRGRMNRVFMESRIKVAEINADIETSISGIRVSKSYTSAENEIRKFDHVNEDYKQARKRSYRVMAEFHSGMQILMDALYLTVLLAGGVFFFKGEINAGEFTAYLLYINSFLNPIQKLVNIFEQIQDGMTGFKRFCEIMDEPEEPEAADAVDCGLLKGDIVFDDVSFTYKDTDEDNMVIHHLSLNIPSGKTIALVGPSGGGKTTVCHLIPRFYEVNSGTITVDGMDITSLTRQSLRKNIGMVAQDVFLFNGTIRENIALGKLDATDEEIIEAAKKANIHEFVMSLEQGYDTNVGERGVKLSGGQKQRISIARVFLKNPPILIL
ncbi:MAG: ABC transporter ATP-binding protein, partial [Erysipelotrichaceae bacterium]|nr:ABC transporter ATP-binding protein [Erysipelotrichaceae bacterium]